MSGDVRKVCMLGDFSVGKTSLVSRFVHQAFSERYLTTVGVKIDTKSVQLPEGPVKLVIWDLAGSSPDNGAAHSYLVGTRGMVLVADGTRPETLVSALRIHQRAEAMIGAQPTVLLVNKADLIADWRVDPLDLASAREWALGVWESSALSGAHVDEAFVALAAALR